jgi:hypothetical protein
MLERWVGQFELEHDKHRYHLVVLANVFNTTLAIHERFDLKGSSYKRTLGRLRGTPGLVCLLLSLLISLSQFVFLSVCLLIASVVLRAWSVSSSVHYILLGASVVARAWCGVTLRRTRRAVPPLSRLMLRHSKRGLRYQYHAGLWSLRSWRWCVSETCGTPAYHLLT